MVQFSGELLFRFGHHRVGVAETQLELGNFLVLELFNLRLQSFDLLTRRELFSHTAMSDGPSLSCQWQH